MGFLSKLMKNPLMQAIAPIALTAAMGPAGGWMSKTFPMFSKMSPLMANALKQSALGYGTAALSGSKRPWKGAMYAGLTSIPFSYMSAAKAADAYNKQLAGVEGLDKADFMTRELTPKVPKVDPWWETIGPGGLEQELGIGSQIYHPGKAAVAPTYGMAEGAEKFFARDLPTKVTPWEIMTGRTPGDITIPAGQKLMTTGQKRVGDEVLDTTSWAGDVIPERTISAADADIFTKPDMQEVVATDPLTGLAVKGMKQVGTKADWLPTAVSQAAALYGGRMTPEEEWEQAQRKRRKELAWMYGVDEDMIEGEMDNPWYGGGGYWNKGGIASLDKSYGGDVSGPGTGTSDSIDAKLSDGEFVMTAKAVENLGGGDRYEGARKMYGMMNMLDPQSETMSEVT